MTKFAPTLFCGLSLRPKRAMPPTVSSPFKIAEFDAAVLRYELDNFEVSGVDLPAGSHFVVYQLSGGEGSVYLQQSDSVFYTASAAPRFESDPAPPPSGDGVATPRWHKGDRSWPVHNGRRLSFLGQAYFEDTVVYLFGLGAGVDRQLAIFNDELSRQDAEEHYRVEREDA